MTRYISEPAQVTEVSEETPDEGVVVDRRGDYAARGPYGEVAYGEGWLESNVGIRRGVSSIRATAYDYGVMQVSWQLPTEDDRWDRYAVTRSTLGAPAAIEEGRVIIDLPRSAGVLVTTDEVATNFFVGYSLFLREDGIWRRVASTDDVPVVQDKNLYETLIQAIPNHNFPNEDLERFLDIFAFEFSRQHSGLDAVLHKHDAFRTPKGFVGALLSQYGFGSVVGLGGRRSRNFLEALYTQRKHRGTAASIETIAKALAGGNVQVGTGVNLMHDRNHSRFLASAGSWTGRNGAPVGRVTAPPVGPAFAAREIGGFLSAEGGHNDENGVLEIVSGTNRLDAIAIDSGQRYTLSGYVRATVERQAMLYIEWLDIEGNVIPVTDRTGIGPGPFGQYLIGSGFDARDEFPTGSTPIYVDHTTSTVEWERIAFRQTAPTDAAFARPCYLVQDSQRGEFFFLDDVQIEAAGAASPFEEPRLVEVSVLPHRTNYIRNPSLEAGVHLWRVTSGDLDRSQTSWIRDHAGRWTLAEDGAAELSTLTVLGASHAHWSSYLRLDPYLHDAGETRQIEMRIEWLDELGDVIHVDASADPFQLRPETWTRCFVGGGHETAVSSRCVVRVIDGRAGDRLLYDGNLMEESTVLRQYFDGNLTDSSYYWAGEPRFSESHFLATKDAILTRSAVELLRWLPGDRQVSVEAAPLVLRSSATALMAEAIGYWVADEYDPDTTSYIDQSGNDRRLSEAGGSTAPRRFIYEENNSYAWLPGQNDDYIQFERSVNVDGIRNAVISIDIRPDVLGVTQDIYGQWEGGGYASEKNWLVSLHADNRLQLAVSDGSTVRYYNATTPITIAAGERAEYTFELTDGDVTFRENGAQLGDVVQGTFDGFRSSAARPRISGQYQGGGSNYTGAIYRASFDGDGVRNLFETDFIDQEGGEDWFVARGLDGMDVVVVDEDFGTVTVLDGINDYLFMPDDDALDVGPDGLTVLLAGRIHHQFTDRALLSKKATLATADHSPGYAIRTMTPEQKIAALVSDGTGTNFIATEDAVRPTEDFVVGMRITEDSVDMIYNGDDIYSMPRTVGDLDTAAAFMVGRIGDYYTRMEWKMTGVWDRALDDDEMVLAAAPYLS